MKVVAIGECLLELAQPVSGNQEQTRIGFNGDTINTAIYLSRLGTDVDFLTALGDDPYSDWMIQRWQQEKIGVSHCLRIRGEMPGIFTKSLNFEGESRKFKWRGKSVLQHLFAHRGMFELLEHLYEFDVIYLTGITLSLFDDEQRGRLYQLLERLRADGKTIVFDGNYRQSEWSSVHEARRVFGEMYTHSDVVLCTYKDESALFDDTTAIETIDRIARSGVSEIAVKNGLAGVTLFSDNVLRKVSLGESFDVVDTTAVGDAFNAGYIHTRFRGKAPIDGVNSGIKLAKEVAQQRGNLIDKLDMPEMNKPQLVVVNE